MFQKFNVNDNKMFYPNSWLLFSQTQSILNQSDKLNPNQSVLVYIKYVNEFSED